ncbi:hypothetical protein [Thiomicrospira sp. ALE5]|uniref:hypothetical protein n=1 Tax=Thiomicrospira sp. ALE5 TaxID=748650 RepID=UPI0008EA2B17|nr:hypothetical protein [Thiomicrospira sp. ALE5]SFR52557.1 hypothetical protein SAMN03092900_0706 [Thiomicrospira sp. ALE5]
MSFITFDTLQYAKALEAKGFTTEQAEALAEQTLMKQDIAQINADLRVLKWGIGLVVGIAVTVAIKHLFGL